MSVVLLSVIAPMTTRLRQRRVICPSIRVSARGSVCVCVCVCVRAHMCVSNGVVVRVTLLCAFCVYVVVCVRLARD